MGSTLREYNSQQKRNLGSFVANTWQHLPHLLLDCCCKRRLFTFYGVFWPLLPHPSTDRNETRTWSSLSPIPSHKIWYKSVHNLFSYRGHRQTYTQTDTQTNAGKTYSLAFAGRNIGTRMLLCIGLMLKWSSALQYFSKFTVGGLLPALTEYSK